MTPLAERLRAVATMTTTAVLVLGLVVVVAGLAGPVGAAPVLGSPGISFTVTAGPATSVPDLGGLADPRLADPAALDYDGSSVRAHGDASGASSGSSRRGVATSATRGVDDLPVTFRGDTRAPGQVFDEGFQPKGQNYDLFEHAAFNPPDSGFVSTSRSAQVASGFPEGQAPYVYEVRAPGGIDVNPGAGRSGHVWVEPGVSPRPRGWS